MGETVISAFQDIFHEPPALLARAPGRVNLLGEHVDYNQGPVLPAAIDRSVQVAASLPAKTSRRATIAALDRHQQVTIDLDALDERKDADGKPLPGWARYPGGVAWALQKAGYRVSGLSAAFTSDVPAGAGLSSSAALELAFAMLWQATGGWKVEPLRLAQLCQRAENEYVGVACGLMDQFASACGVKGSALYFDTRSLEYEAIPLPEGTTLVIADSGVRRSLSNSAYNERRQACEKAVELLRAYLPDLASLRDITTNEFAAYSAYLPGEISKRAEHVVKEIARVVSARSALHRQDKMALGALMYSGHTSLQRLYEVSTPELDALVKLAREQAGCIGARLTGAGFGGCTVNLVEQESVEKFVVGLKDGYAQATGRQAVIFPCVPSQGASFQWL